MVWIETPTNPTMQLIDIAAIAKLVKEKASPDCFVVVDNTFMSSYFQVNLSKNEHFFWSKLGWWIFCNYYHSTQTWLCYIQRFLEVLK